MKRLLLILVPALLALACSLSFNETSEEEILATAAEIQTKNAPNPTAIPPTSNTSPTTDYEYLRQFSSLWLDYGNTLKPLIREFNLTATDFDYYFDSDWQTGLKAKADNLGLIAGELASLESNPQSQDDLEILAQRLLIETEKLISNFDLGLEDVNISYIADAGRNLKEITSIATEIELKLQAQLSG